MWGEVESHQYDPPASKLVMELFVKPIYGNRTDVAAVIENEAKLSAVLDLYEKRLSKTKYLAADFFILVDLWDESRIKW